MVLLFVCGCSIQRSESQIDFEKFYEQINNTSVSESSFETYTSEPITLSAQDMPLGSFLRLIAQKGGISIVAEDKLDTKLVTIDVTEQPIHEVLSMLSRRLNCDLTKTGNLYYLGAVRAEDRGVYVRKVNRLDQDQLKSVSEVLLSSTGRTTVFSDGLVVVGDRVEILRRIDEMFNKIESAPINSWCLQLFVISVSDSFLQESGIDTDVNMDISYQVSRAAGNTETAFAVSGILSGILKAEKNDGRIKTVTRPTFIMQDGNESVYHSGQTFKIPIKTVSDAGTITTTGFEDVDTGLYIKCLLVDCGVSQAQLTLELNNSSIISYSESAPNLSTEEFSTTSVINSGQVYLLGSFDSVQTDDSVSGLLSTFKSNSKQSRRFLVWSRAYKVL